MSEAAAVALVGEAVRLVTSILESKHPDPAGAIRELRESFEARAKADGTWADALDKRFPGG